MRRSVLAGAASALLTLALILPVVPAAGAREPGRPVAPGGPAGISPRLASGPPAPARRAEDIDPADERARRWPRARLSRAARDPLAPGHEAMAALRASLLELAGLERLAAAAQEEHEEEWSYVTSIPAGDLDGDGREDLLEYEYREIFDGEDYTEELTVSGVKGTTGATLWSLDGSGFEIVVPAGNLDGEPGTDLLTMVVEIQPPPGVMNRWDITYGAISGSDGSEIWSRTFVNEWRSLGVLVAGVYVDRDFALPEAIVGDVDDDGATDLLISRHDITIVETPLASHVDWTTRFEALSGRTGEGVFSTTRQTDADGEEFYGVGTGDVAGDGSADIGILGLLWDEWAVDGTLTAHDGRSAAELWVHPFASEDLWGLGVEGLRLDGDQAGDVLLTIESSEEDSDVIDIVALSGASGSPLWDRHVPGYAFLHPTGDADGDGGRDLLLETSVWTWDENDVGTGTDSVALVHGASGAEAWSWAATQTSTQEHLTYWGVTGDTTGDGILDIVITHYQRGECYEEVEDGWVYTWCDYSVTGDRELVSGADTAPVWSRPARNSWLFGTGDLDGDGHADLIDMVDEEVGEAWFSTYVAVSGRDGSDLWPEPVVSDGYVWWVDPADLLGGPGADLVETVETLDWEVRTDARRGTDGTLLWRRPA